MKKLLLLDLEEDHESKMHPKRAMKEEEKMERIGRTKGCKTLRTSPLILTQGEKKRKINFLLANTAIKQVIKSHGVG